MPSSSRSACLTSIIRAVSVACVVVVPLVVSESAIPVVASANYRLDEAKGSTAKDSSGHGRQGTYAVGVTRSVQGAVLSDTDTAVQSSGVVLTQGGKWLPHLGAQRTLELWYQGSGTDGTLMSYGTGTSQSKSRDAAIENANYTLGLRAGRRGPMVEPLPVAAA